MARQGKNNITGELAEQQQALSEHRAIEFVEDGGKTIITCPRCGRELVEVWMHRPNAPIQSEIVAVCPCGDKSYVFKTKGQFSLGNVESKDTIMVDTDTDVKMQDGTMYQKLVVYTEKGD